MRYQLHTYKYQHFNLVEAMQDDVMYAEVSASFHTIIFSH
jgi:hypothetical protein